MTVDRTRSRQLLQEVIELGGNGWPAQPELWHEAARVALVVSVGENHSTVQRFDQINFSHDHSTAVRQALALLSGVAIRQNYDEAWDPVGQSPALHPWFGGIAAPLINTGRFRQAIVEGTRAVEIQLKAKLLLTEGSAAQVIASAFSVSDPAVGQPRLRFRHYLSGSNDWRNAHEGALHLGYGCFLMCDIYPRLHEPTKRQTEELLASLSLLAHWIDEANAVSI